MFKNCHWCVNTLTAKHTASIHVHILRCGLNAYDYAYSYYLIVLLRIKGTLFDWRFLAPVTKNVHCDKLQYFIVRMYTHSAPVFNVTSVIQT